MLKINSKNVELNINNVPTKQLTYLLGSFVISNPDYKDKIKKNLPTTGIPKEYSLYTTENNRLYFPRGLLDKVTQYFDSSRIKYTIEINKPNIQKVCLKSKIELREEQSPIIEALKDLDMGLYCAPCGVGKTVIGLKLIETKQCSTMILVHTVDLMNQWIKEIKNFFNIDCGIIGNNHYKKRPITVALMQTVVNNVDDLENDFDMVFVDEAHHTPCDTMLNILTKLNAWYRFGTTATPKRKDKKEFLLHALLGKIEYEITNSKNTIDADVYLVKTDFYFPYYNQENSAPDEIVYFCKEYCAELKQKHPDCLRKANKFCEYYFEDKNAYFKCKKKFLFEKNHTHLVNLMANNDKRNRLIFKYLYKLWEKGLHILLLFDRKASISKFSKWLDVYKIKHGILVGGQKKHLNEKVIQSFKDEKIRIILGTKVADEGLDLPILDTVLLANPCVNNKGLLKQRIGRVERIYEGKERCQAIYFWDEKQFQWHYKRLNDLYGAKVIKNPQDIFK